ncbi:MAG: hypothetical protein J0I29_04980 [Rhizobiales bacterium]|nr:hypothetical protein [Hyphomicrobiales bacterium]
MSAGSLRPLGRGEYRDVQDSKENRCLAQACSQAQRKNQKVEIVKGKEEEKTVEVFGKEKQNCIEKETPCTEEANSKISLAIERFESCSNFDDNGESANRHRQNLINSASDLRYS